MQWYFSGCSGNKEVEILTAAGATHILVDPFTLRHADCFDGHIALDSGAYAVFKQGRRMEIEEYVKIAHSRNFDFRVSLDVIGDPKQTYANWKKLRRHGEFVPIWHYGTKKTYLRRYLDQSELVAIGGAVQEMRNKNGEALEHLAEICQKHPGRFHFLGLNWLKAIRILRPFLKSADSSKHIDARRYGHILFVHTRTGHLQQAPAKCIPQYTHLTTDQRLISSAQALMEYTREI